MLGLKRLFGFIRVRHIDRSETAGVFLSSIGAGTYALLKLYGLVAPDKPSEKSYEHLKDALKQHLKPKRLVIAVCQARVNFLENVFRNC